MMAQGTEIFQDESGGWRFRVKGANGEIVATSESYSTKFGAIRGVSAMTRIVTNADGEQAEGPDMVTPA